MVSYTTRIEQSLSDRLKEHSTTTNVSIKKIINKALENELAGCQRVLEIQ